MVYTPYVVVFNAFPQRSHDRAKFEPLFEHGWVGLGTSFPNLTSISRNGRVSWCCQEFGDVTTPSRDKLTFIFESEFAKNKNTNWHTKIAQNLQKNPLYKISEWWQLLQEQVDVYPWVRICRKKSTTATKKFAKTKYTNYWQKVWRWGP